MTKLKNKEKIKKKALDTELSVSLDKADMIWVVTRSFEYRMVCLKGPYIYPHAPTGVG